MLDPILLPNKVCEVFIANLTKHTISFKSNIKNKTLKTRAEVVLRVVCCLNTIFKNRIYNPFSARIALQIYKTF